MGAGPEIDDGELTAERVEGAAPEGETAIGPGSDDTGDDRWALDPPAVGSTAAVEEEDPEREQAWHITRDGWLSAESIGTHLRDRFASEDLETGRWSRGRRTAVALAVVVAASGAAAAIAVL